MRFCCTNIQYLSLPDREGQGGLWTEIRESLVSLPKKPEGSEIQPSLVDSIKTLNDASFSLLIEKQKNQDVKNQDIY